MWNSTYLIVGEWGEDSLEKKVVVTGILVLTEERVWKLVRNDH